MSRYIKAAAKVRGIMHRIYKVGMRHELVTKNPVQHVETRSIQLQDHYHFPCTHARYSKLSCLHTPLQPRPGLRGKLCDRQRLQNGEEIIGNVA